MASTADDERSAGQPRPGPDTGRLEVFSDGVFAIAVTLPVLDLRGPLLAESANGPGLLAALRREQARLPGLRYQLRDHPDHEEAPARAGT